ncbi:hypothetical protein JNB_08659 [Janibacter sp. HTCC2649]|uniref:hypothetical protein n=1 Tax=Janibacter sp. HTCC2649 TaxID=313589 RepID=UPI0000670A78|nr:hypothetical protein [Janibacter sp. HTCC2649]EAQ00229.1 hypothetical protein JNB_08659 [Janibacter sp. HTCC2649]
MKYVLVGLIVVIAILAYLLSRRGSTGVSGDTEKSVAKALGQSHRGGPGSGGVGGGI